MFDVTWLITGACLNWVFWWVLRYEGRGELVRLIQWDGSTWGVWVSNTVCTAPLSFLFTSKLRTLGSIWGFWFSSTIGTPPLNFLFTSVLSTLGSVCKELVSFESTVSSCVEISSGSRRDCRVSMSDSFSLRDVCSEEILN